MRKSELGLFLVLFLLFFSSVAIGQGEETFGCCYVACEQGCPPDSKINWRGIPTIASECYCGTEPSTLWAPGTCETQASCQAGCCVCKNTQTNQLYVLPSPTTAAECRYKCNEVLSGYEYSVHDTTRSIAECSERYNETTVTPSPPIVRGTIYGFIRDESNNALSGITVSAANPYYEVKAQTDSAGKYNITGLIFSSYTVKASDRWHRESQGSATLSSVSPNAQVNLNLQTIPSGIITGVVKDQNQLPVSGAIIYIGGDAEVATNSQGEYTARKEAPGTYSVYASRTGYDMSDITSVSLTAGQTKTANFEMNRIDASCLTWKPADFFNTSHKLGSNAVNLLWVSPTCENIVGYNIYRNGQLIEYIDVTRDPYYNPQSYSDSSALWNTNYEYGISLVYDGGDGSIYNSTIKKAIIRTGDFACENKYILGKFSEFCEGALRKTCDSSNKVISASATISNPSDCSVLGTYLCAGPTNSGLTYCRNVGNCNSQVQQANPFGMYFNPSSCIGTTTPNFCFYDFSSTVVDACFSCQHNMSCFNYKSEQACTKDNCEASGSSDCGWITVSEDLNNGICYSQGYNGTDQCKLCGPENNIFFSTGCTQEVCSKLGSCFANSEQTACEKCKACEDLTTEVQCIGLSKKQFTIGSCSQNYQFNPSGDSCGIGICRWADSDGDGTKECFKDGNSNNDADCDTEGTDVRGSKSFIECKNDITAPDTYLPLGTILLGAGNNLLFTSSKDAVKLHYCIDQTNTCCPDSTKDFLVYSNSYGVASLTSEDLLSSHPELIERGDYYFVRYYAVDEFNNQEQIKNRSMLVDLSLPLINANIEVFEGKPKSNISITLDIREEATCVDELVKLPCDSDLKNCQSSVITPLGKNFIWNILYNVDDGNYIYKVTCTDGVGNKAEFISETILVDGNRNVIIVAPKGPIKQTAVTFDLITLDASSCKLYNNNSHIDYFTPSVDYSRHNVTRTIAPNNYYSNFKAVCNGMPDTSKEDNATFEFTIDLLSPVTNITAREGDVQITIADDNWELWFNREAVLNFTCTDSLRNSFGCDTTRYCVSPDKEQACTPNTAAGQLLTRTTSSKVCYNSVDKGGNTEPVKCGVVHIGEPGAITLVYPPYGVSNIPVFDMRIRTKVESSLCKYALANFNWNQVVQNELIFTKLSTFEHKMPLDFNSGITNPYTMFVKCQDKFGAVSIQPSVFAIRYDSTPPVITDAYASPNPVMEGSSTSLVVITDEPTICKFSKTATDYNSMAYSFSGWEEFSSGNAVFSTTHDYSWPISGDDNGKSQSFNVICQNEAGNISTMRTFSFLVDFSLTGYISSTLPQGSINYRNVNLTAITSKIAECVYQEKNGTWNYLVSSSDNLKHTAEKFNLAEGQYTYPLKCLFTFDAKRPEGTGTISFRVDLSPPNMSIVEDGEFACGNKVSPQFVADDASPIANYNYSVVDSSNKLIVLWTLSSSANPSVTLINVTEGQKYFVQASAIDSAGNKGTAKKSDGFIVLNANDSRCLNDKTPPNVKLLLNLTYQGIKVTMICTDNNGCDKKLYGISTKEGECAAKTAYTEPVFLKETSKFCWNVSDNVGNYASGNQVIEILDSDGDGVPDLYDKCSLTKPGEKVDSEGCSADQREGDSDKDGVSDSKDLCPDTPADEINLVDKNGCSPSQYDKDKDGVPDKEDICPDTPAGEEVDSQGCGNSQKDTDGDGMDDAWELRSCGSITGCDPDADNDGDGLTNLEEYNYFKSTGKYLNPNSKDTDGDGYSDYDEIRAGSDPTNPFDMPSGVKWFPWLILILGIVLFFGGLGYAVYLYYTKEKEKKFEPPVQPKPSQILINPRPGMHASAELSRKQQLEIERRREEMQRYHKAVETKQRKRSALFESFGAGFKKPESSAEKPTEKPKVKEMLSEKNVGELKEFIEIPKEKTEFDKLAKMTEAFLLNKGDIDSLRKMTNVPEEHKEEFSKLAEMIERRVIPQREKPRELSDSQREEIRKIFEQLYDLSSDKEHPINKLKELSKNTKKKEISKKTVPKENVFDELKKISHKKKKVFGNRRTNKGAAK